MNTQPTDRILLLREKVTRLEKEVEALEHHSRDTAVAMSALITRLDQMSQTLERFEGDIKDSRWTSLQAKLGLGGGISAVVTQLLSHFSK